MIRRVQNAMGVPRYVRKILVLLVLAVAGAPPPRDLRSFTAVLHPLCS